MSTIQPSSFQDILLQSYRNTGRAKYVREDSPDAATLRSTLQSLGFGQAELSDAVTAFQKQYNAGNPANPLKADGKAGTATLTALYETADRRGGDCRADVAKFMDAKSKAQAMIGAPDADHSVKANSHDPQVNERRIHAKLHGRRRQEQPAHEQPPGRHNASATPKGESPAQTPNLQHGALAIAEEQAKHPLRGKEKDPPAPAKEVVDLQPNAAAIADRQAQKPLPGKEASAPVAPAQPKVDLQHGAAQVADEEASHPVRGKASGKSQKEAPPAKKVDLQHQALVVALEQAPPTAENRAALKEAKTKPQPKNELSIQHDAERIAAAK